MQNEVEIDLLDLGKKLLLKWKQIIIITIVIAAVFTGYRYMQSVRSYQASLAAQQENEDADTITKNAQAAYDALSEEEQSTVQTALRLREEIEADQEYMEAALLMQIDPYEESVVTIQYQIADVEEDEMIGKTLEKAYLNYLNSAGYQDEVVTQLDWDEDAQYICELISATSNATNAVVENSSTDDETNYYNNIINLDSSDAFFAVTVKGVDSESAEELATALQQVVNKEILSQRWCADAFPSAHHLCFGALLFQSILQFFFIKLFDNSAPRLQLHEAALFSFGFNKINKIMILMVGQLLNLIALEIVSK